MGLLKPLRNTSPEETSLVTAKTSCFLVRTAEENRACSNSQAMDHSQEDGEKYILGCCMARVMAESKDSMWLGWG